MIIRTTMISHVVTSRIGLERTRRWWIQLCERKKMDRWLRSPACWFTDGLEKQAGTTVHAKVSSYRARLLLPRPGRRRCNKIGEKKIFINARVRNSGKYCQAFRKTFPFPFSSIYISLSLFLSLLISLHFPHIVRDSRLRTDVQPRANKSAGFVEAARKKENDIRIRRQRIPRPRAFSFQSARARISLWCANATGGKKEESRGRQPGKTGGFMNRSVPLATFPPHRFQIRIVERRSARNVAEDNSFECIPHIRNGTTTFIPLCPDSSSLRRNPSREHYPINFSAYAA